MVERIACSRMNCKINNDKSSSVQIQQLWLEKVCKQMFIHNLSTSYFASHFAPF